MRFASASKIIATQTIVIAMFFLQSCGLNTGTTATMGTCSTGTAQIEVQSGQMIRLCGCAESVNTTFANGSNLQCTIPTGTQLYFYFVDVPNTGRQITISTLGPLNPVYPTSGTSLYTRTVLLNTSGTFTFQDYLSPGPIGTLIIQ